MSSYTGGQRSVLGVGGERKVIDESNAVLLLLHRIPMSNCFYTIPIVKDFGIIGCASGGEVFG